MLSVSALKGGVGKTTITLGLASSAMSRGLRTLIVDLDPQGNASTGLGQGAEVSVSAAEVLKKPKRKNVLDATFASTWAKGQTGRLDIMVSSGRLSQQNIPNPSFKKLWNLDEALSRVEGDYDLVIIDTPPNINALTRMAWVASDRIMLITEPSINSLIAVSNAVKATSEIRKQVNRQVRLFGIVINRLRASLAEHQFRVNELQALYPDDVCRVTFEEKSPLSQAQGAGRSIHSWPGQAAAKLAGNFDQLLEEVIRSFAEEDMRRLSQPKNERERNRHSHRTRDTADLAELLPATIVDPNVIAEPERVEMVNIEPVSEDFKDKWNEALRQTLTEKQRKALLENQEDED